MSLSHATPMLARGGRHTALSGRRAWLIIAAPAVALFLAFWLLPMVKLAGLGATAPTGETANAYWLVVSEPRYWKSLFNTVGLSLAATLATLIIALPVGRFLARHPSFPGRRVLMSLLIFPLAFPGVVVGFLVILTTGRQGVLNTLSQLLTGEPTVLAYAMPGLFIGYVYFLLPRTIGLLTAAVEGIDKQWLEAAQTLGASTWRRFVDIELPALTGALTAAGAMCFATAMGAFGTVFTLGTRIDVLPITIYDEFTNYANLPVAAALSVVLGLSTWAVLYAANSLAASR
ncbi:ABC transporter permease [Salinicola aestuarinus]|uniref:ABC transporter permease n=1 Tax=Salinicola aestuarinus TaxID=1949082 RepID=UPI001FD9577F|nr:ABC transporter permease [Salinicola aestuarinus]